MTYQLPVGFADRDRLNFQSQTLERLTRAHIMSTGLFDNNNSKPLVIADFGCGIGSVTLEFLKLNNEENIKGKVSTIYAIDNGTAALTETRKNVDAWCEQNPNKIHPHVEYILLDIREDINILLNSFDLIFVRFVLNNIATNTHKTALTNIKNMLKPGGQFVCEETIWENIMCSHESAIVNEYKNTMYNDRMKSNIDLNVGKYLVSLVINAGLIIESHEIINRSITPLQLRNMYDGLMTINYATLANDETKTIQEKEAVAAMFHRWDVAFHSIPENDPSVIVQTSGTSCVIATKM